MEVRCLKYFKYFLCFYLKCWALFLFLKKPIVSLLVSDTECMGWLWLEFRLWLHWSQWCVTLWFKKHKTFISKVHVILLLVQMQKEKATFLKQKQRENIKRQKLLWNSTLTFVLNFLHIFTKHYLHHALTRNIQHSHFSLLKHQLPRLPGLSLTETLSHSCENPLLSLGAGQPQCQQGSSQLEWPRMACILST